MVRQETGKRCIGKNCFNAFFKKLDSFQIYDGVEVELVGFFDNGGDYEDPMENIRARIEKLKKSKVDIVHVSTCMRAMCDEYEETLKLLNEHFEVVGYTHGSSVRKTGAGHKRGSYHKNETDCDDEKDL